MDALRDHRFFITKYSKPLKPKIRVAAQIEHQSPNLVTLRKPCSFDALDLKQHYQLTTEHTYLLTYFESLAWVFLPISFRVAGYTTAAVLTCSLLLLLLPFAFPSVVRSAVEQHSSSKLSLVTDSYPSYFHQQSFTFEGINDRQNHRSSVPAFKNTAYSRFRSLSFSFTFSFHCQVTLLLLLRFTINCKRYSKTAAASTFNN